MTVGSAASAERRPGLGDLGRRGRSALLFVLVFLASAVAGPWPFAALIGLVSILVAWELRPVLTSLGWRGAPALVLLGPAVLGFALSRPPVPDLLPWVGIVLVAALAWLVRPVAPLLGGAGSSTAWSPLVLGIGALYTGLLPSFLVRLHAGPWNGAEVQATAWGPGAGWVVYAAFLVWAADTGAYLIGVRFGRHRLWEAVSPKKSWEGCFGGLLGALVAAFVLAGPLRTGLSPAGAAGIGLLAAVAAPLGDLFESRFKRVAGIKDSGHLIPGHGGILDRFDSLFFCAPLFYYYLRELAGRF